MVYTLSSARPGPIEGHRPLARPGAGEFLLVGIEIRQGRAPRTLLARDALWGLEYVGSAELELADGEAERFWREVDRLRSDYPHVRTPSRNARWLKPFLTVQLISHHKCRPVLSGEAGA